MSQDTLNQSPEEEEKKKRKILAILLILLLAFGAGFAILFKGSPSVTNTDGTVALTQADLVKTINSNHLSAYWVGPVADAKYTLTVKPNNGGIIIRYIPNGSTIKASLVRQIATYTVKNAASIVATNGAATGNLGFTNVDGNSVFYSKTRATNVYVGIKGKDTQVEVFDPLVDQALALTMLKGQVRPVVSQ